MGESRIYIIYDYDEKNVPINIGLWWRQPPRFFYDSKVVPPDYFGHSKLVLAVVQINDNGVRKYDFAFLAPNMDFAKYKEKNYTDNIQGSDRKIVSIEYLTLDVNG